MTGSKTLKNVRIIFVGLVAVVLAVFLVYGPGWKEEWYQGFYRNQYLHKLIDQSKTVDPFEIDNPTLAQHIHYQDLLLKAGVRKKLDEQYAYFADVHGGSAAAHALYARVAESPATQDEELQTAERIDADDPAVGILHAEKLMEDGKFQEARQRLQRVMVDGWINPYMQAKCFANMGDSEEAAQAYRFAVASASSPEAVAVDFARYLCEESIRNTGADPFAGWGEEQLIQEPEAYAYHIWLAEKPVPNPIEELPTPVYYNARALSVLARAAMEGGQYEAAGTLLQRSELLGGENEETVFSRALLALKNGDAEEADKLLRPLTGTPELHARAGTLFWKEGEKDAAIRYFKNAPDAAPADPVITAAIALDYAQAGDCANAAKVYAPLRKSLPDDAATVAGLADAFLQCGDEEKAIDLYASALDRDFEMMDAREKIADLYIKQGNKTQAIAMYVTYISRHPDCGGCYIRIAKIHHQFGDDSTAKSVLAIVTGQENLKESADEAQRFLQEIEAAAN